MNWLDFSRYENSKSKFKAELSVKGGYITFSNSGKRGGTKYFTLSLEAFLKSLKDILANYSEFASNNIYDESKWRELGENCFSDETVKAMIKVQTKPFFATLSKIIMWANSPEHDENDPEEKIILDQESIKKAIQYLDALSNEFVPENKPSVLNIDDTNNINFDLTSLIQDLQSSGLIYSDLLVTRFVASLLTKPFVILTGLSGSGKTKLAQAFVQWICQNDEQYCIVPVGADWTNREPLLGYPNALNSKEYIKPDSGVLDLLIRANNRSDLPHFLILDEMNLSHVERYFADFLSVMESKEDIPLFTDGTIKSDVPAKLKVPSNLFIIGTVNIDETTHMFSPKVLDRANTIEFRVTQDEMKQFLGHIQNINMDILTGNGAGMAKSFLNLASVKSTDPTGNADIHTTMIQFFGELKKAGAEFGYRSATEILQLIHQLTVLDRTLTTEQKIDIAIMQKLLPKLHGSRRKLSPVLETLGSFCIPEEMKIVKDVFEKTDFDVNSEDVIYPLSLDKISRMYRDAIENGFASFAEA